MQYTASSFARPILRMFHLVVNQHQEVEAPQGLLPAKAKLETHSQDPLTEQIYRPIFSTIARVAVRARRLQGGHNQVYVLYLALALLVLLVWKLGI